VAIGAARRHAIQHVIRGIELIEEPNAANDEHDDKDYGSDIAAVPTIVFRRRLAGRDRVQFFVTLEATPA
jgi:hypothetical protein